MIGRFGPQEPHHALGIDPHQDRSAVEEDLVETADQHQHPAAAIQSLEDRTGGLSRGLDPAMNRRATGTGPGPEEEGQQVVDLAVAEPHAHALGGEHLLLGRSKVDGLVQPVPQLGIFLAEDGDFPVFFLMGRSAAVFGLDGRFHLVSMVVDGLPMQSACRACVVTEPRGPLKRAAALAIQLRKGSLHMGVGPLCVGVWYTTTHLRSIPSNIKSLLAKSGQVSS